MLSYTHPFIFSFHGSKGFWKWFFINVAKGAFLAEKCQIIFLIFHFVYVDYDILKVYELINGGLVFRRKSKTLSNNRYRKFSEQIFRDI